jgi:hypothetical protein
MSHPKLYAGSNAFKLPARAGPEGDQLSHTAQQGHPTRVTQGEEQLAFSVDDSGMHIVSVFDDTVAVQGDVRRLIEPRRGHG